MNTQTSTTKHKVHVRETYRGISPSDFRHDLLKQRLNSSRNIKVRTVSRELGISYGTFYNIVNGSAPASKSIVIKIAELLGFTADEIIPKNLSKL